MLRLWSLCLCECVSIFLVVMLLCLFYMFVFGPSWPRPPDRPAGRQGSGLITLGARSHNTSWHLDGCLINWAGPAAPWAVEKLIFTHHQTLPAGLPSSLASYGCCGVLMAVCAPVFISALVHYTCAHLWGCWRIRQLWSCESGKNATSFVDLPFAGQPVRFHRRFIHSRLENGQSMTQRLLLLLMVMTGAAVSQGRLMFYPFTRPLCVNATLNYLAGMMRSNSSEDRRTESARLSQKVFSTLSLPLPLILVWSHLIDIFLIGHDLGWESKVAAF